MSGEQLNDANREFEQIAPSMSAAFSERFTAGFQVRTLVPGMKMIGATAYSSPGDGSGQFGPSPASSMFLMGSNGLGDPGALIFNLIANPPTPTVPNPGTEPPVGPEERLRYSCLSGKCIQDPNGQYYGIDECLADACGTETSGGGKGCDCGFGLSHTVFKGEITAAAGPYTQAVTGRIYWLYSFLEVNGGSRTGQMYNEYELTMPNNGGNTVPAGTTVTRLRVPTDAVVPVFVDETGVYWFQEQNPLQIVCP